MSLISNHQIKRTMACGIISLAAISMAILPGCGGGTAAGSGQAADEPAESQQAEEVESSFDVTIDGCTVTTDYEGAPAIVVDFTFTNNSEEDTSFAVACSQKAFQNGVQLESAIVTEDLGNGYLAEIKPGATTEARMAFTLTDESDVTVEVEELFSLEEKTLAEQTFSVA